MGVERGNITDAKVNEAGLASVGSRLKWSAERGNVTAAKVRETGFASVGRQMK